MTDKDIVPVPSSEDVLRAFFRERPPANMDDEEPCMCGTEFSCLAEHHEEAPMASGQVVITCDECGKEDTSRYVMPPETAESDYLAAAIDHLLRDGWSFESGRDLCPGCLK